jgi:hypothetical protein
VLEDLIEWVSRNQRAERTHTARHTHAYGDDDKSEAESEAQERKTNRDATFGAWFTGPMPPLHHLDALIGWWV